MYLAKQVGRWSTTVIGRFYNGRDHSTVCYAIQRIKALRQSNPEVDQLLTILENALQDPAPAVLHYLPVKRPTLIRLGKVADDVFLEDLADRIAHRVARLLAVHVSGKLFVGGECEALIADHPSDVAN